MRMIRGETQFNKVSRFVKEIPKELLSGEIFEPRSYDDEEQKLSTFLKAKQTFRRMSTQYGSTENEGYQSSFVKKEKPPVFTPVSNQRSFAGSNTAGTALSYQVGDRVRHIKFGDGEVMAIVEGGRDYEVTVDFDKAGTKKMFASFAKLKKID